MKHLCPRKNGSASIVRNDAPEIHPSKGRGPGKEANHELNYLIHILTDGHRLNFIYTAKAIIKINVGRPM